MNRQVNPSGTAKRRGAEIGQETARLGRDHGPDEIDVFGSRAGEIAGRVRGTLVGSDCMCRAGQALWRRSCASDSARS